MPVTIPKAIEILQLHNFTTRDFIAPSIKDAIELGIEAMKRINDQRLYRFTHFNRPLPSETEK